MVATETGDLCADGAYGQEHSDDTNGRVDLRKETRYSRFKSRIPAGTEWTFIAGYEPDVTTAGTL